MLAALVVTVVMVGADGARAGASDRCGTGRVAVTGATRDVIEAFDTRMAATHG